MWPILPGRRPAQRRNETRRALCGAWTQGLHAVYHDMTRYIQDDSLLQLRSATRPPPRRLRLRNTRRYVGGVGWVEQRLDRAMPGPNTGRGDELRHCRQAAWKCSQGAKLSSHESIMRRKQHGVGAQRKSVCSSACGRWKASDAECDALCLRSKAGQGQALGKWGWGWGRGIWGHAMSLRHPRKLCPQ